MPKCVSTPKGPELVLTAEEFLSMVEEDAKKEFDIWEGTRFCLKCGELVFTHYVEYRVAACIHLPDIPSYEQCYREDDIVVRKVHNCVFCDGWPDLNPPPVALFGSFHNRPH